MKALFTVLLFCLAIGAGYWMGKKSVDVYQPVQCSHARPEIAANNMNGNRADSTFIQVDSIPVYIRWGGQVIKITKLK